MKLMLKIAWRNIFRHKGKSLIIGIILFLGAILMTVGNGVIAGMDRGISRNIVNAFMGDMVVVSDKQRSDNVMFDFMGTTVESFNNYKQLKTLLKGQDYIDSFMPAGKNLAIVLSEDQSSPGFAYLIGVDFDALQKMFPGSFKAIEGHVISGGEKGLVVPAYARNETYNMTSTWLIPESTGLIKENLSKEAKENIGNISVSSTIVFMGMSSGVNSTTDVRFTVKGIIKYNALNTIFGHFCLTDIETYRECLGYFSAADSAIEIPEEEKKLLSMDGAGLDSLFGSEMTAQADAGGGSRRGKIKSGPHEQKTAVDPEGGAYNLVFIKLKKGVSYAVATAKLNKAMSDAGLGLKVLTWNKAAGMIGSMTLIIKGALFLFVTLLFVVAVIIIVNTLTMAALERTPEIGMMRAVGARKSFIAGMFFVETGMLSAGFGGAGMLLGIIAVKLVPLFKITSANDFVQLLYGGDVFNPVLSAPDIFVTALQLAVVTLIAALYPVSVAKNITPLDAVQRD